jgi:hypothetical protein
MENNFKLMHGDIVANNLSADCGRHFFVLNPCKNVTTSLDDEEADNVSLQVVVQSLDDKYDFRYISYKYFENGKWFIVTNQNKKE